MKLLYLLSLFIFLGYSDKKEKIKPSTPYISRCQNAIQNMLDSFKIDYGKANTDSLKDTLIEKYQTKLFDCIYDYGADSIKVHVDAVIIKKFKVTTSLHCTKDILFKYSLNFLNKKNIMKEPWRSEFEFVKGLKVNTDTIVSFGMIPSVQLNNPSDSSSPTLIIFGFPEHVRGRKLK